MGSGKGNAELQKKRKLKERETGKEWKENIWISVWKRKHHRND
jgi:hypothetical protein